MQRYSAHARCDLLASDARGGGAGVSSAHPVEYRVQPQVRLGANDALVGLSDVAAASSPPAQSLIAAISGIVDRIRLAREATQAIHALDTPPQSRVAVAAVVRCRIGSLPAGASNWQLWPRSFRPYLIATLGQRTLSRYKAIAFKPTHSRLA